MNIRESRWLGSYFAVRLFFDGILFKRYHRYKRFCSQIIIVQMLFFVLAGFLALPGEKRSAFVVYFILGQYMASAVVFATFFCVFLPRSLFTINEKGIENTRRINDACMDFERSLRFHFRRKHEISAFQTYVLFRMNEEIARIKIIESVLGPILAILLVMAITSGRVLEVFTALLQIDMAKFSCLISTLPYFQKVLLAGGACTIFSLWIFVRFLRFLREMQLQVIHTVLDITPDYQFKRNR